MWQNSGGHQRSFPIEEHPGLHLKDQVVVDMQRKRELKQTNKTPNFLVCFVLLKNIIKVLAALIEFLIM